MPDVNAEQEAARILAEIGASSSDPEICRKLAAALEAAEQRGRRQSREEKQSSG